MKKRHRNSAPEWGAYCNLGDLGQWWLALSVTLKLGDTVRNSRALPSFSELSVPSLPRGVLH